MSQFNEKYNLDGIDIFSNIPSTVDTPTISSINTESGIQNKCYSGLVTISPRTTLNIDYTLLHTKDRLYKSNITTALEDQHLYYCNIRIRPTNRLTCIGDIYCYNDKLKYKCTTHILSKRNKEYRANISIKTHNSFDIKFSVYGGGDRHYRARIISRIDKDNLYNSYIKVPVIDIPILNYKSRIKVDRPWKRNYYNGLVTISPRTNLNINYDLLSGRANNYKAYTLIGKEYEKLYSARFIINPTNRLTCIGDIYGYNESEYKSNIRITAERKLAYPAKITIALGNHMYTKFEVQQTPKHYFYGDLKKDAHVIETKPTSNYGGDDKLFLNNKSIVFLEWDFNKNLDEFYIPEREDGAGLRIFFKKALPTSSLGKVYLVNNNWEEYKINYENKPTDLKLLKEFTVPPNFYGRLDIRLDNFIKDIEKTQNLFTISLAVEIDSPINTHSNSRETNIDIPALYYDYWYIPPNNRQTVYKAVFRNEYAYGKGSGKDTKYPALGEEQPWSEPARIYRCNFYGYREAKNPIKLYKAKIKIPSITIDDNAPLYRARLFNNSVGSGNFISKAKIKVPKYEIENIYNGHTYIPERTMIGYKAVFNIPKKIREKYYTLKLTNIRAYGKGSGEDTDYPALGEEQPWSKEARIWKAKFQTGYCNKIKYFMCKINNDRAYGKGSGKDTKYPALGEEQPWSEPARIYRCNVNIGLKDDQKLFKVTFFNDNIIELQYKSKIKIPKYDNKNMYNCNIFILTPTTNIYDGNLYIPLFNNDKIYKANFINKVYKTKYYNSKLSMPLFIKDELYRVHFINRVVRIKIYNCKIRISPEKVRVQIFIM